MTPKIFERIYIELKREVTSGKYLPGQRLQARTLADALRTSTSPVNQAMRQLIGEQVLEYSMQDGFIIPRVTERRLRDLFEWSAQLFRISGDGEFKSAALPLPMPDETEVLTATETLFLHLAGASQNAEAVHAIANMNDRLRSTRRLEQHMFTDRAEEVGALIRFWNTQNMDSLRAAIDVYHHRRLAFISQFLGLSYQDQP